MLLIKEEYVRELLPMSDAIGLMRGAFVRSWRLAGMQNLMLKMFDDPDFVHRLAELTLRYNLAMLDLLVDAGLDVLVVEDDIAAKTSPLISPGQFAEFVNPYNRKLVDRDDCC